jgi:hypothetical protein
VYATEEYVDRVEMPLAVKLRMVKEDLAAISGTVVDIQVAQQRRRRGPLTPLGIVRTQYRQDVAELGECPVGVLSDHGDRPRDLAPMARVGPWAGRPG